MRISDWSSDVCSSDLLAVNRALVGFFAQITDCGRTLACNQHAMLIAMFGIAAREHGRAGEAGVLDVVAVKAAVLEQLVAGPDWRVVEPPFLATEDQMRVRNLADAGRMAAVAIIHCHRERLRRDRSEEHTSELQ